MIQHDFTNWILDKYPRLFILGEVTDQSGVGYCNSLKFAKAVGYDIHKFTGMVLKRNAFKEYIMDNEHLHDLWLL